MAQQAQSNISLRASQETREQFDYLFEESGANSKGEFLATLLDRYENPPARKPIEVIKTVEVEKPVEVIKTVDVEKMVEVEKQLNDNQLLLTLSPAELFALRETVLSFNDFAEMQNKIIESLAPENKPFFHFGSLFDPEVFALWRRNRVISKNMTKEEREEAIKFNISALLVNTFIMLLVKDEITETLVTPEIFIEFLQTQADPTQANQ